MNETDEVYCNGGLPAGSASTACCLASSSHLYPRLPSCASPQPTTPRSSHRETRALLCALARHPWGDGGSSFSTCLALPLRLSPYSVLGQIASALRRFQPPSNVQGAPPQWGAHLLGTPGKARVSPVRTPEFSRSTTRSLSSGLPSVAEQPQDRSYGRRTELSFEFDSTAGGLSRPEASRSRSLRPF